MQTLIRCPAFSSVSPASNTMPDAPGWAPKKHTPEHDHVTTLNHNLPFAAKAARETP